MNTPSPGESETGDIDIHGKLSHLDAIDMSSLSLSKRYAMITLSGPWSSDDYGRFTTTGGAYPRLPALSDREASAAVRGLIADNLIRTWTIGGTTCWEVAGAYAFKPGLKQAKWDKEKLSIAKRTEQEKRKERKKDAEAGLAFRFEDDGEGMAEDGAIIHLLRTKRGNLIPAHKGLLWYRSNVPIPKRGAKDKMIVEQPNARPDDLNLRMLPSFNPSEGLSPLETVLRHYLLMDSDDYGRVRLDIPRLLQQLGSVITKRISRAQVEAAIGTMIKSGHLMEIRKKTGRFAFVRDSAQHMRGNKRYNRELPRLHDDQNFTYNSEDYVTFFRACEQHSSSRPKVSVAQYNIHGDVHVVEEYLHVAADRFVREYQELMKTEPWMSLTPRQFCFGERDARGYFVTHPGGPHIQPAEIRLWHAIQCKLPAHQLEEVFQAGISMFDDTEQSSRDDKTHKIFTHLLQMTAMEYVDRQLKAELDLIPHPPEPSSPTGTSCQLSASEVSTSRTVPTIQDPPPPPLAGTPCQQSASEVSTSRTVPTIQDPPPPPLAGTPCQQSASEVSTSRTVPTIQDPPPPPLAGTPCQQSASEVSTSRTVPTIQDPPPPPL